ncbi:MAG TPA: DinB family protein [Thermomicrobiales bacterium]|jgi:hypothetical protein
MTGHDERKQRLVERLASGRESFLAAVAVLDEADLAAPVWTEGGHWTARELIAHVAYAESGMLGLIVATIDGRPAQLDPAFDIDRYNEGRIRRAKDQTVPDLLAQMDTARQETLQRLGQTTDAELDLPAYHPVLKETTVEGIFRVIGFHERMHAKDLRTVHERSRTGGA